MHWFISECLRLAHVSILLFVFFLALAHCECSLSETFKHRFFSLGKVIVRCREPFDVQKSKVEKNHLLETTTGIAIFTDSATCFFRRKSRCPGYEYNSCPLKGRVIFSNGYASLEGRRSIFLSAALLTWSAICIVWLSGAIAALSIIGILIALIGLILGVRAHYSSLPVEKKLLLQVFEEMRSMLSS